VIGAAGAGAGAAATCRASPALAVGVSPFCWHDPNKPAMPITATATMACLRGLMLIFLSRAGHRRLT
jgi:hypothetical protein